MAIIRAGAAFTVPIELHVMPVVRVPARPAVLANNFAIGIGDSYRFRGVDESALRKIAERTGGRAYFPRDEADLRAAFKQIERELREQYLVAYAPTNQKRDATFRKVQIEIVNPELRSQGIKLNYRQGYFARSGEKGKR